MNQKIEMLQIKDLPPDLLDEIQERIKPHIIGLMGVNVESSGEKAQLIGSGTLVQIKNKYGIITAQHLTNKLGKFEKLGLNLETYVHKCEINNFYLNVIDVGTFSQDQIGPDLAVIILPENIISTLKAKKLFWDISNHIQTVLSKPITQNLRNRLWIVCGFPEVWSKDMGPVAGFDETKSCCCLCGFTGAEEYWTKDEFDYIKLSVRYENGADLPKTFGGVSGGGVWSVELYRSEDGKITSSNPLFLGVAIRETPTENNLRSIIAHSWRSIYEVVPSKI